MKKFDGEPSYSDYKLKKMIVITLEILLLVGVSFGVGIMLIIQAAKFIINAAVGSVL